MNKPIKQGLFSYMEAKSILGECSLTKVDKLSGRKVLRHTNYGYGPSVDIYVDEVIQVLAYASILDKSLFVYADTRSILG